VWKIRKGVFGEESGLLYRIAGMVSPAYFAGSKHAAEVRFLVFVRYVEVSFVRREGVVSAR